MPRTSWLPASEAMPDVLSLNQLVAERVREHPDLQILAIPDKNFVVRLSVALH